MSFKAVLFDFNGLIIQDELIGEQVLTEILLKENLLHDPQDYRRYCLGKSDRTGLKELLASKDRIISDANLTKLIKFKTEAYQQQLLNLEEIPIYPGLVDFLEEIQKRNLVMAIVTGALREEVKLVLAKTGINAYFQLIVAGDDLEASKPEPDSHLLALQRLKLFPQECLAIETTFSGIDAAKKAKIQVLGVANFYPVHMLQRRANWTVDRLSDLELDRLAEIFAKIDI
ncbi:HAD family phosphatase [Gloeocapsa sp. PCC 73106]|uniref:HAD family hydrolase n=1 Tax=Gloeocapsa sp. PCC 73106 TaxID=102232 RepID=UPI0002ACF6EE|nr:HAD family phosphatase [Gloeocapsa sp. PCC 73106]ELR97593.1 haloacid dehalogenase superfamily protein, subfamily IA, variant 3 with third motif having DD or ED [Gloeocapsa sp. PCC 73106]